MFILKFVPLVVVMLFDLAFTLLGQPDEYWDDHDLCDEANRIGNTVLSAGPGYFVLLFILYVFSIVFLVRKLPKIFGVFVAVAVFLAHTWGSASWLLVVSPYFFPMEIEEWALYGGYFLAITMISGICFWLAGKTRPSAVSA